MANNSQAAKIPKKTDPTTSQKSTNVKPIVIIAIVCGVILLLGITIGGFLVWRMVTNKVSDKTAETLVESALGAATGSKVDVNKNGDVSVQTKDGSASYKSGQKLSEDFPKIVPLYPNQVIQGNFRTKNSEGEISWTISAVSKDSTTDVSQYFKNKMSGWTNPSSYEYNSSSTFSGEQGKLKVVIGVGPETNEAGYKTRITYSIIQQP
jgi:hypothetical protein